MDKISCVATLALTSLLLCGPAMAAAESDSLVATIESVQPKIVKINGAGGLRGLESYQSGVLISDAGHVLTVWSYVLDTRTIGVTLWDGRTYEAALVGADPQLEIAVLKIDAEGLPHFKLAEALAADEGARVLAFSNLFAVAVGDEPVSVLHGVVSARTKLSGRRGAFDIPYRGSVYVVDAITNNPGAAGGALTDQQGRLLGLIGKELRNSQNNTWLNYAMPIAEIADATAAIQTGKIRPAASLAEATAADPVLLDPLGVALVPDVLERTPPYIDDVRAGSPAAAAGLKVDDLVLFVDDVLVQSCSAVQQELRRIERTATLRLTVLRDNELVPVELPPAEMP